MAQPIDISQALDASDAFRSLVDALKDRLGSSSGIDSDDVKVEELKALMRNYASKEPEWSRFDKRSLYLPYTRNLVDKGNGKSNLLLLSWRPGQESAVHDHANAHCIMKILKGQLLETRFHRPTVEQLINEEKQPLVRDGNPMPYNVNEVTYMSDDLGLHKIGNPDPQEWAVSLHLYTPPNAAVYGCNKFDEQTGKPSHVPQNNFYSTDGIVQRSKQQPEAQL
ncbi:cysteine dioxygenase [Lophiotrema nucula]|uniref:Cysteine dioxygenase n=1 Tax=Lophiotrema nucula TaxID=690887 RepID=A0A6A5YM77_9PLEO|nr:cysteine dioxygenase [Lophiotrema nucula]